jgi:hypothetical protein
VRDRKETAWYQNRLKEARKPLPMTDAEKAALGLENKEILANAKRIAAAGVRRGWISPPKGFYRIKPEEL